MTKQANVLQVFLRFPMNGYFDCLLFFYTFKKCCDEHLSNMPLLLFSHSVVSGSYVISVDCSPPGSSVHGVFQALNYLNVLPFPGDLPGRGIKPVSPTLASGFFMTELLGILRNLMHKCKICSRTALFNRNTCESHRFSSSHIKNQNQTDAVNFNNAFYLTQYIQNIITSTCNKLTVFIMSFKFSLNFKLIVLSFYQPHFKFSISLVTK